jgi:hypothetical protein
MSIKRAGVTGSAIAAALLGSGLTGAGCAPLPRQASASVRQADYLASQRELSPEMARAIGDGHIALGMDTKQVWVVLGDPARKTRFDRTVTEVWLYKPDRLHQDHFRLGTQDVRLIFVKDRLVVIEPM